MSPVLIGHHKDHSSPHPLLFCNSPCRWWETWLCSQPSVCLTALFQSRDIVVPGLLTCTHSGRQLHPLEISTCVISSAFAHSRSHLRSAVYSPASSSEVVFTFLIQLDSFVTVCIPSWDPTSPKWTLKLYFKNLHTLSIPLCRVYGFDRCLNLVFTITKSYRMVLQLKKKKKIPCAFCQFSPASL